MYIDLKYPNLESYITDLQDILTSTEDRINELVNIENKDYDNFIKPYSKSFDKLGNHTWILNHINSVKNTDETQKIKTDSLPILSEWYNKIGQREDIYESLLEVSKTDLNDPQQRVVEESLLSFRLNGIGQEESIKQRIGDINTELSILSNEFSNNLLLSTKEYSLIVDNVDDVKEFPSDELERHISKEDDNKWEFNLQPPSYSAYMKYGTNPDIRRKLYTAYVTRAPMNEDIIESILTLKREKSKILGYNNYAEISLLKKMARSPEEVLEFMERLKDKSKPYAEKDEVELNKFILESYGIDEINPWDKSYYINKYQEKVFDFKSEELQPYFEQSSVLNGMFDFLNDQFGLSFKEVNDTYIWDEKVKVFDVTRNDKPHSRVYFDLESRDDKRGGAWMNESQTGYLASNEEYLEFLNTKLVEVTDKKLKYISDEDYENVTIYRDEERVIEDEISKYKESGSSGRILPIAYVTCNFTPSTETLPSLLKHSEVETLFHEMGHILQHICSEVDEETYAGIGGIEWDAVEWSSQFLELFVYEPSVLKKFGKHHKSGETIPTELIDKINSIKSYREGTSILRQLELGMFDMKIHTSEDTSKKSVQTILNNIREDMGSTYIDEDKFQNGFSHIFSGGYSAGYYSYKWAEVLSVDAFLNYKEKEDSDNYYDKFLSKGSSKLSMDMFIDYMGREPNEESLIKYLLK